MKIDSVAFFMIPHKMNTIPFFCKKKKEQRKTERNNEIKIALCTKYSNCFGFC